MEKFTKTTVGFVTQSYEKNTTGKFICTEQEFIAGDQVDYEDAYGNAITPPKYKYQPFNMLLLNGAEISGNIEDVLLSIDVGGEQSRQFATEIGVLKKVLKSLDCPVTQSGKLLIGCFVSEQCSDLPCNKLPVNIMAESGKLWVQPAGYGDKTSADGHGWPIGLEIWQGRLRLIVFDDINTEEPKIIDLEKSKEDSRVD